MEFIPIQLEEVDLVEILTVMDNYVDLLLDSTEIAARPPLSDTDDLPSDTFLAEHGLSLLITVKREKETHTVLLDTGYSEIGVIHNMERLHIDPDSIETIVISHAHMDHNGSLYPLLDKIHHKPTLVVHPSAFHNPRFILSKDEKRLNFPRTLVREELEKKQVNLVINDGPS